MQLMKLHQSCWRKPRNSGNMAVISFLLFSSLFLGSSEVLAQNKPSYRLCASLDKMKDCQEMLNTVKDVNIQCVPTDDKISCIEKITKNEADIAPLEPEEIYVAHRFLRDGFKVITEVRSADFKDRDFRYEPVAVIKGSSGISSISDLQGRRSCHTGFGRNAGWKIPFSHLMDKGELPKYCEEVKAPTPEKDLYAISNYFKSTCAPGLWVPEKEKDRELKQKYPNLCELCENPSSCGREDRYGGYEGALKCLTERGADIAWTKMDAVISFFKLDSQPLAITSDYRFLCWDGSSVPLNLNHTCSWAKRPWKAYLASSRLSPASITEVQQYLTTLREAGIKEAQTLNVIPPWIDSILEIGNDKVPTKPQVLVHLESHTAKLTSPIFYLDKGKNYSVTIEKPSCATENSIRFCVKSELEKSKCLALQLAALGRRVLPRIDCVLAENNLDCIKKINEGKADLVNLSPKDSDWAQRNYELVPILSEVEDGEGGGPFRYVLAVIKTQDANLYRNISLLKGKKSCHTSINDLASWNGPIAKLRELGVIGGQTCGLTLRFPEFFGNTSCIPGTPAFAMSKRMGWLRTKDMCKLCVGDAPRGGQTFTPETVCADTDSERYYGPSGALQCLMEVGDVAFLDHVGLNSKVLKDEEIKAENLRLLCPNGGSADIHGYQHCNWGKVPSNQILSRGGSDYEVEREDVRLTLLKVSDTLGPSGKNGQILKLFGPYFGNNNLLFSDTSVGLCDYKEVEEYKSLIGDFDYCTTSGGGRIRVSVGLGVLLVFLMVQRV